MGIKYFAFRLWYELFFKLGLHGKRFPANPPRKKYLSIQSWLEQGFFIKRTLASASFYDIYNFEKIKQGDRLFFSKEWFSLGKDYDWVTNPSNGYSYSNKIHWSKIKDYSSEAGDIKYVWEPSRFTFIYDVIRHDQFTGQDNSQWIWDQIQSWINSNPINCGPNYKCSQEISLRVLNWTFALHYYKDSKSISDCFFQEVMHVIEWQIRHVYNNINFSRIAVRNNHAITESLALYITGNLFPFFENSNLWKQKGKKWFEEEIAYQVYSDGTYLQFSHNYHRVVIQLFNWAFMVSQLVGDKFADIVYERSYVSLDFLYNCQDDTSGWLSNYGSNDGALFFPLSNVDFRDFRPQLQTLHVFLTGSPLYEPGPWDEESLWMNAKAIECKNYLPLVKKNGWKTFPKGGFYLLREDQILTFIRCGSHNDRPAHADNLHVDIWNNGKNIAYDCGSYKYNTDTPLLKYFMGTASHNTIMLGDNDQMLKGGRFIWYYWSQSCVIDFHETEEAYFFVGKIRAFKYLGANIFHQRKIKKYKANNIWEIEDFVENKPANLFVRQLWHKDNMLKIDTAFDEMGSLLPKYIKGYKSDYYGVKEDLDYLEFSTLSDRIVTTLKL